MSDFRTPYFVVDEVRLKHNLTILQQVAKESGARILLAQKAFSMFACYPLIASYLSGTTASGLYEARLGKEKFGGETHVFAPAYREDEFIELLSYADPLVFNSPDQVARFGPRAKAAGNSIGLRIHPECSPQAGHAIYDPCAPGSRLGTTLSQFDPSQLSLLDGLHFHTLCEQNSDALETTLQAFEEKFGAYLPGLSWLNLGGGHHITRPDYDRDTLIRLVRHLRDTYGVTVYLEPGEAVVYYAGDLISRVLAIVPNGDVQNVILDTSAACHMPDVLEMPYRPPVQNAGEPGEKPYVYRLTGPTCLAGDIIGDYSFDTPLREGDTVTFQDMALYTMVKTNTFNGQRLPDIRFQRENGPCELIRSFSYEDFAMRLS